MPEQPELAVTSRPRLEVCSEQLLECAQKLAQAGKLYQHFKSLLAAVQQDPARATTLDIGLKLDVAYDIPVTMPADPAQCIAYLEEGIAFLGVEVVELWKEVLPIATQAASHCAAATAASQVPPSPGSPAPALPGSPPAPS